MQKDYVNERVKNVFQDHKKEYDSYLKTMQQQQRTSDSLKTVFL